MSAFNLTYKQLKEKSGIEGRLSDNVIHRWIQLGLIVQKKNFHSAYSDESVTQLKLCSKLKLHYGKTTNDMKLLLENYSVSYLLKNWKEYQEKVSQS